MSAIMRWLSHLRYGLRALFSKRRLSDDLSEEMRLHLDLLIEQRMARGMSHREAEAAARREFGNLDVHREHTRDTHGWRRLDEWRQDMSLAIRRLARARAYTILVACILALGIGCTTAVFHTVRSVLWPTDPFPPGTVQIGRQLGSAGFAPTLTPYMADYCASRDDLFGQTWRTAIITGNVALDGQPLVHTRGGVGPELLESLNAQPVLGRGFRPDEYASGQNHVVIVSHDFWQRKMGSDPRVLERELNVDGTLCPIVGVMGRQPNLPPNMQMWVLQPIPTAPQKGDAHIVAYTMWGQLREGITPHTAAATLADLPPDRPRGFARLLERTPLRLHANDQPPPWRRASFYQTMLGAVGFLIVITVLNASTVVLVRTISQSRELGIRLALGSGRGRIMRLHLVENMLLALLGGIGGLVLANTLIPLFKNLARIKSSTLADSFWQVPEPTLGFLILLAGVIAGLISLGPAWRIIRGQPEDGLRAGPGSADDSRLVTYWRNTFIVLQVAAALTLLAGTGLIVRSFDKLQNVAPGFAVEDRWKITLLFPRESTQDGTAYLATMDEIKRRIEALPEVVAVAYGSRFLNTGYAFPNAAVEDADGAPLDVGIYAITPEFPGTAGLDFLLGRNIDDVQGHREVLINESLARLRWPDENPVGQLLRPTNRYRSTATDAEGMLVVGVIRNPLSSQRLGSLPSVYRHATAIPLAADTFIAQTAPGSAINLIDEFTRLLYAYNPALIVYLAESMEEGLKRHSLMESQLSHVLKWLAFIAVALTASGLFASLAYTVAGRTREIGIRMAVGAQTHNITAMILWQGARLTLCGIALGLTATWGLTRFIESQLYDTSPTDPRALAQAALLLAGIAVAACWIPARRAAQVDPVVALRAD